MNISTKLQRIAKMAREHPTRAFTNLAHYIDLNFLREAFRLTRKDGAPGVDGVSGEAYGKALEVNLQSLLDRFKSGTYRAPDVRRVHIPKGKGQTRPLGIPTFEDKVLQRAVAMILEAIYEQDFLPCSFGFRPGRSAHQALTKIRSELMSMRGGWVVEADIKDCFGAFEHEWIRKILNRRIRDGVLIRTIGKWLNAGIMEDGQRTKPTKGTPQGGLISPLLANIFLHEVLDAWFYRYAKPLIGGHAELVRFADDFVILCDRKADAERFYKGILPRFEKFGLTLHPEKTKLVPFKRPPRGGPNESESWDFLGFTHYGSRSRKGYWVIFQKTMTSRLSRGLCNVAGRCRRNRHLPVRKQHQLLSRKLLGHCAYYGITGNSVALQKFRRGMPG
ncbi:MAG: RNA-directed DNA polymerase [Gammaproteobacteria bacterium]|jgi:RNA-directed DNA polymerase